MSNSSIMVSMKFQADTSQAKAKMKELETSLRSIQSVTNQTLPMNQLSSGLDQAKVAAAQLEVQLKSAFNTNTGKLDLSKFNSEMKKSGMNLEKYKTALLQAGPAGKRAFTQLATAIASADTRVIRINESLAKMGHKLLETARWRASNAAIMAVTSSISEAYRFAQDLDKSLTDIRIVTGLSAEYMEDFAKQAQKAAKALSTTTNEYAKASLIYFQQGLSEAEVQERTELTIRMANVTGQSVQEVSDQLTAVWNNFDDGTQTLEHYVDVMVALGAATASSSEEISQGLNKFAAVAETVGLSYEYAAAALATVTAETRQSADVVGTAFKTLFARIQDLELGETLDDGTTLGQYSQALAAVGINIKDVNGEVKDMNLILDEMGSKWNNLTKDQQIALAQNVAGVRQYTQLIALMDNWSTFQNNLNTAMTSQGASQEQAEIYAESWKAARDKVTASLEQIYMQLLDDDAFKSILNFFADLIENIGGVVEAVGGLKGILNIVLGTLVSIGQKSIVSGIQSVGLAFRNMIPGVARKNAEETRQAAAQHAQNLYNTDTVSGAGRQAMTNQSIQMEQKYYEAARNVSAEKQAELQILKEALQVKIQSNRENIEAVELAEKEADLAALRLNRNPSVNNSEEFKKKQQEYAIAVRQNAASNQLFQDIGMGSQDVFAVNTQAFRDGKTDDASLAQADTAYTEMQQRLENLGFGSEEARQALINMFGQDTVQAAENFLNKIKEVRQQIAELQAAPEAERSKPIGKDKGRLEEIDAIFAEMEAGKDVEIDGVKIAGAKGKEYRGRGVEDHKKYSTSEGGKAYTKLLEEREQILQRTQGTIEGVSKAEEGFADSVNYGATALEQGKEQLLDMTDGSEQAAQDVEELTRSNEELGVSGYNVRKGTGEAQQGLKTFEDEADKAQIQTIGLTTKIVAFSSMMMSAAMALNAFKSLGSIWNDEDATFGEKILQIFMQFGMILPAVTNAFNAQNVARLFGVALTKKENGEIVVNSSNKLVNATATRIQKLSHDSLNISVATTIAMYALLAIGIAAVIAVIWAISKAFEKEATAAEKAAENLKHTKEAAEDVAEALEETKSKAEALAATFEEYKNIQDTLKGLTEDTLEWQKAILESQKTARELLEMYPQLRSLTINGEKAFDFDPITGLYTAHEDLGYVINAINNRQIQAAALSEAAMNVAVQDAEAFYLEQKAQENASGRQFWTKTAETWSEPSAKYTGLFNIGKGTYSYSSVGSDLSITMDDGSQVYLSKVNEALQELERFYIKNIEEISSVEDFQEKLSTTQNPLLHFTTGEDAIFTEAFANNIIYAFESELEEVLGGAYDKALEATIVYSETVISYANQLASELLMSQEGFINASALQRQAATVLLSKDLQKDLSTLGKALSLGSDGWQEGEGGEIIVDWLKSATNQESVGWDMEIGIDENLAENAGSLVQYYAKKYLDTELENIEYDEEGKGFIIGDQTISGQQIISTIVSDYLTDENVKAMDGIMTNVIGMDKTLLAGIAGNFNALTEDEVNSISEVVSGQRVFKDDYIDKLTAAGLTTTEIEERKVKLQEYNAELAKTQQLQQQLAEGEALIASAAEEFDFDPQILSNYARQLQNVNDAYKKNYKLAAQAAIANAKFSKGLEELQDIVPDNLELLKQWNNENYQTIEAATKVASALSMMFGVDVSLDFVKSLAESGDDLEKLISGTEEASEIFEKWELAAAQDYVVSLGLSEEWTNIFQGVLADLTALEKEVDINGSISLNDTNYVAQLNEMLKSGAITAEQVQQAFGGIGWSPNITYGKELGPETKTIGRYTLKAPDPNNLGETIETTYKYENVSQSEVSYPILGDKDATGAPTNTNIGSFVGNKSVSNFSAGKKSGGGGGGSKQKKKDTSEIPRYHEIQEVIDDLSREYDKLSQAKDRAFGADRLSLMDKELELIEKQIEAQEEQLRQIEEFRKLDKEKLSEYGASFDEAGRITNFDEMYEANIKSYNEAVDKVNSGAMPDDQFEEYEKQFDEFVADIEQYEETLNLLEDEEVNLIDLQNQLFDAKLAKISYEIEIDTRLAENEIAYLEYQFEKLDDTINDTALSLQNLGKQAEQNLKKIAANQRSIKDTLELSGFSEQEIDALLNGSSDISSILKDKALTDEQISMLEEYRDSLMDTNTIMLELRQRIHDELVGAFEEMNEEMDYQMESIDHLSNMLQNYRDIIDLVGHENLGISDTVLAEMSRANVENTRAALQAQRNILDSNKAALADAEAALARARVENQEEDIKLWEETVKTLSEKVAAGEEELMSRWQSALQAAADAFSDAVDQVMEDFEKAMTGVVGGFDALQEKYNQQKEINERYLDDYQKIYELSKLNRDITKSIDDTDSIRAKTRLRDIQEEINALQESNTEMTQYEVDELRARYELRLAEIALEEAQNAKNQVRMSRDSEGNWSYVYTANQENVDDAMQNYEDKLYAYQTLTQERAEEIEEQILGLPKEFSEAIQEIMMDLTLTEEEKEQKKFDTRKYYEDKYNYLLGQISISLNDAKRLYENDWRAFSQATGYKISDAEEWQDKFDETILAQSTGYTSIEEAQAKFNMATNNMFSDLLSAYEQYKIDTDNIMSEVAMDAEVFTEKITNGTQEAADSIKSLADAGAEGFSGLVEQAQNFADSYGKEIDKYIDKNDEMITSLNKVLNLLARVDSGLASVDTINRQEVENAEAQAAEVEQVASSGGGGGGGLYPGGPPADPPAGPPEDPKTTKQKIMYDADGSSGTKAKPVVYLSGYFISKEAAMEAAKQKYIHSAIQNYLALGLSEGEAEQRALNDWLFDVGKGKYYVYSLGGSGGGLNSENNRKQISAFASGGYTGEWGAEGRIAMLHQKELVLNADDTTNFLSAIKIIRDISRVIDLRATAQQSALSAMTSSTVAPMAQILQQEVTIHAEFPNATQRTEIEAAFDTLLNRASQFANRKNK